MSEDDRPIRHADWERMKRRHLELRQEMQEMKASIAHVNTVIAAMGNAVRVMVAFPGEPTPLKVTDARPDWVAENEGPKPSRIHNPKWRTYAGFRADMIRREEIELANQKRTGTRLPITKELLAGQTGGDTVKTISRAMKRYGLDPDRDWPPSAWPEQEPRQLNHDAHSLLAAALLPALPLMLDLLSDGKLNHIINMLRLAGCSTGLTLV